MEYSVTLGEIQEKLRYFPVFLPDNWQSINVVRADINRPGLPLAGYMEYYDPKRIILMGLTEVSYFNQLDESARNERMEKLLEVKPPAIIISKGEKVPAEMMEMAKRYEVPLFSSPIGTSTIFMELFEFLSSALASRTVVHGVLMEVYGFGVLITGDSGVGKSEAAIELIMRGHRLVADDAVEIKLLPDGSLVGTSPEVIRHYIELRGVGIVDVRSLFGMASVKKTEEISLVAKLESWDRNKYYERMGMDNEHEEILGVKIPSTVVPVRPGRNLATIIEVAAMNARMNYLGRNAAMELDKKIMDKMDGFPE